MDTETRANVNSRTGQWNNGVKTETRDFLGQGRMWRSSRTMGSIGGEQASIAGSLSSGELRLSTGTKIHGSDFPGTSSLKDPNTSEITRKTP